MNGQVHVFDNGVKVYEHQLLELQKERYALHNVHESDEEDVFLDVLSKVKNGGIYVNVGAAIGYYPILAALKRKDIRIVAYEPLKMHRSHFLDNLKLNGLKRRDFKIYKEGVYVRNGEVNFRIEHYGSKITEDRSKKNALQQIRERINNQRINCITLADLYRREKAEIDLLQMDIQGLEADVLESSENILIQHKIRNFLIGTHSSELHLRCKQVLLKDGYRVLVDNFDTKFQPDGILLMGLSSS